MKINNKTNWNEKDLRKIFSKAMSLNDKIEGRYPRKSQLLVEVVYAKRTWAKIDNQFSGYAYRNGNYMKLKVPRKQFDQRLLARVFIHELYHCRGFSHDQMGEVYLNIKNLEEDNWALEYPVRKILPKKKPKEDLQIKRYEHVLAMLKDKQLKLKRLQKQVKKWNAKKKYYEKTLVAAGKIKMEDIKNG
jgi:hypothetical protein